MGMKKLLRNITAVVLFICVFFDESHAMSYKRSFAENDASDNLSKRVEELEDMLLKDLLLSKKEAMDKVQKREDLSMSMAVIDVEKRIEYDCIFTSGDATGSGSETKVGNQKGVECINACLALKKEDDEINGVTTYSDSSKGGCWCESNVDRVKPNSDYQTCFLVEKSEQSTITHDYSCSFKSGDGAGGSEIKVGNQKGKECVDACLALKKEDVTINGVTVYSDSSKEGCWCESNMNYIWSNSAYQSCFLLENDKNPSEDCYGGEGRDYDGTISTTVSGYTCRLWTDSANGYKYRGKGEANYCRNPLPSD